MSPIPKTRIMDKMTKLRGFRRSSRAPNKLLRPTTMMDPNSIMRIPPITGVGMVCSTAPSLPMKDRAITQIAAQVMISGLNARVSVSAAVISEYVALGGPPSRLAKEVIMRSVR